MSDFIETGISIFNNDGDFSSAYPTTMRTHNVSRATLNSAVFLIEGKEFSAVGDYFGNLVNVRENSVPLCSTYHGFPNYSDMFDIISELDTKGGK